MFANQLSMFYAKALISDILVSFLLFKPAQLNEGWRIKTVKRPVLIILLKTTVLLMDIAILDTSDIIINLKNLFKVLNMFSAAKVWLMLFQFKSCAP